MTWEIQGNMKNVDYFYRYCLGSTVIFYIFDLSNEKSFLDLEEWVDSTKKCEIGYFIRNEDFDW